MKLPFYQSMRMKSLILMTAVLLAPSLAFAEDMSIEDAVGKAVANEMKNLASDTPSGKLELPKNKKSPTFLEVGGGGGAAAGGHSSYGATVKTNAGMHTKIFLEGSDGKDHQDGKFCTGNYFAECQNLPEKVKNRILGAVDSELRAIHRDRIEKEFSKLIEKGTLTDAERDRITKEADKKYDEDMAKAKTALDSKMKAYETIFEENRKAILAKPDNRPMIVLEGKAGYNMIGSSEKGGTFTGVEGKLRFGAGFSLKEHGKNGCDIYFLATAVGEGQVYHKLEKNNYGRVAIGLEQGPLCQVANTVTFMASPSVQAGGMMANDGKGGEIRTDWLNYAGRARLIVDDRLYASAEAVHHPSMSPTESGARWTATHINGNVDVKVSDKWIVGGDIRHTKFVDQASSTTGNPAIKDTFVGVHAWRAF